MESSRQMTIVPSIFFHCVYQHDIAARLSAADLDGGDTLAFELAGMVNQCD
jgi:hypothetical protein